MVGHRQTTLVTTELTSPKLKELMAAVGEYLDDFDNPYVETQGHELKDFAFFFDEKAGLWTCFVYLQPLNEGATMPKPKVSHG